MKKTMLILISILVVLVSTAGCGNRENENLPTASTSTTSSSTAVDDKEPLDSDWKPTAEKDSNVQYLANIKQKESVGNTVNIEELDIDINYDITVNKVYITKNFEEDVNQWNDFALEDVKTKNNAVTGDNQIIYIEYQVKNLFNETLEYYADHINVLMEENGILNQASYELGYNSNSGKGKSANMTKIKPQETKTFRIGYVLDETCKGKSIYLELSNSSSDTDFILIPVNGNK